jgi:hypothetical protein
MLRARLALLFPVLIAATSFNLGAQDRRDFNEGLREGGHGGYYDQGYDYDHHRDHDYDRDRDRGIGPGKGALIGGGGGAAVGALLGGGLKGSIIGGVAGAGIGAVLGEQHQKNERNDDYYRR